MDVLMSKRGDCADDYVEIRDGPTETSPLLGKIYTKQTNVVLLLNMLLVSLNYNYQ